MKVYYDEGRNTIVERHSQVLSYQNLGSIL